jgi:hypothetical protein
MLLITGIPMLQVYTQPANLVLQDTTIATTAIFAARNSITAGPNFTITGTGDATLVTGGFIYFRPGIVIIQGGKLRTISDPTLDVRTLEAAIPAKFSLEQNYPNPFNPSTTIKFSLPKAGYSTLKVFDVLGREVAMLVSENLSAGAYQKEWNASNVASGMYFYRLKAGDFVQTKKLLLVR